MGADSGFVLMCLPLEQGFDSQTERTSVEHVALKQPVLGCSVVCWCCSEGYLFFSVPEVVWASWAGDLSGFGCKFAPQSF